MLPRSFKPLFPALVSTHTRRSSSSHPAAVHDVERDDRKPVGVNDTIGLTELTVVLKPLTPCRANCSMTSSFARSVDDYQRR